LDIVSVLHQAVHTQILPFGPSKLASTPLTIKPMDISLEKWWPTHQDRLKIRSCSGCWFGQRYRPINHKHSYRKRHIGHDNPRRPTNEMASSPIVLWW